MTSRSVFRLLFPLVLIVCGLLASAAGAATRPPSDAQLRAAAGKLIPTGSALTDVSSSADLAQATRKVVVEFRPEDRGGAQAISRSTYDPANPLPISGLVLRATRAAGGVLTYDITAVSESQPRFLIRGQRSGGQQTYLQLLSLTLQPLTEESAEIEAWFTSLQFSDNAYRVLAGSFLYPASGNAIKAIAALTAVYKSYRFCDRAASIMPIVRFRPRCVSFLITKTVAVINMFFPAAQANQINGALFGCAILEVRRAWRRTTGYNAPTVLLRIYPVFRARQRQLSLC